jgi:hypothetical protein
MHHRTASYLAIFIAVDTGHRVSGRSMERVLDRHAPCGTVYRGSGRWLDMYPLYPMPRDRAYTVKRNVEASLVNPQTTKQTNTEQSSGAINAIHDQHASTPSTHIRATEKPPIAHRPSPVTRTRPWSLSSPLAPPRFFFPKIPVSKVAQSSLSRSSRRFYASPAHGRLHPSLPAFPSPSLVPLLHRYPPCTLQIRPARFRSRSHVHRIQHSHWHPVGYLPLAS